MKKISALVLLAVFLLALIPAASAEQAKGFIYTDEETGASFVVPAGWKENPSVEKIDFIDVLFTLENDPTTIIAYGKKDIWDEMPEAEKAGKTREDADNTLITREELAASLGVSIEEVQLKTYGGKEYYEYSLTTSGEELGIQEEIKATYAIIIKYGYYHAFQLNYIQDNPPRHDFETLLKSAIFPKVVTPSEEYAEKLSSISAIKADNKVDHSYLWTISVFCLISALIPAIIAKIKKKSFWRYFIISFLIALVLTAIWALYFFPLFSNTNHGILLIPFFTTIISLLLLRKDRRNAKHEAGLTEDPNRRYTCTSCNYISRNYYRECPKCGAVGKMVLGEKIIPLSTKPEEKLSDEQKALVPESGPQDKAVVSAAETAPETITFPEEKKQTETKETVAPSKPKEEKTGLAAVLDVALQFRTDDGLFHYLKAQAGTLNEMEKNELETLLSGGKEGLRERIAERKNAEQEARTTEPKKEEKPRTGLSGLLEYALQFRTTDGMLNYLKAQMGTLEENEKTELESLLSGDKELLRQRLQERIDA